MQTEFYSNGKLLLSGEYVILDGALGLALPTKFGQSLRVENTESQVLAWESFDENNQIWFRGSFDLNHLDVISTSDISSAKTLLRLLKEAKRQNPFFLSDSRGLGVTTHLDFPREWGLGSSSTLINNIAQWAKADAFELLWNAFGGSGYDIACAQNSSPIIYQLFDGNPVVDEVQFKPPFLDSLFFVYLNQKQSSRRAIESYRKQKFNKEELITRISAITKKMVTSVNLEVFKALIEEHESEMSQVLGISTVKQMLFPDYPGAIKSLGAWGGDFVMATGRRESRDYFASKGYSTLLSFDQMIL